MSKPAQKTRRLGSDWVKRNRDGVRTISPAAYIAEEVGKGDRLVLNVSEHADVVSLVKILRDKDYWLEDWLGTFFHMYNEGYSPTPADVIDDLVRAANEFTDQVEFARKIARTYPELLEDGPGPDEPEGRRVSESYKMILLNDSGDTAWSGKVRSHNVDLLVAAAQHLQRNCGSTKPIENLVFDLLEDCVSGIVRPANVDRIVKDFKENFEDCLRIAPLTVKEFNKLVAGEEEKEEDAA